jgi:hypothetical protein
MGALITPSPLTRTGTEDDRHVDKITTLFRGDVLNHLGARANRSVALPKSGEKTDIRKKPAG